MAKLKIITDPHPTLRKKAEEINLKELKGLKVFIDDMENTMVTEDGLGLAGNQVDFPKRIFVINTKEGPLSIINPTLHHKSFKKKTAEEGCLSIPGVYGMVKRHENLVVKGYNKKGKALKLKVEGLFARVVQHEYDHLEGILFTDKAKKITKHDSTMNYENL